jgi:hypothetical protein
MPAVPTDQSWVPDPDQLTGNLNHLRRLLDNKAPRLAAIKELLRAARLLSPSPNNDLDDVLAAVQLAIDHLPRDWMPPAAERLYGLTKDSIGRSLKERRKLAYETYLERYPGFSEESFRTGREQELSQDIATAFVELVVAHNELPLLDAEDDPAPQPLRGGPPNNSEHIDAAVQAAGDQAETPEHDEQPIRPVETLPEPDPKPPARTRTWDAIRRFLQRRAPGLLVSAGVAVLGVAVALVLDRGGNSAGAVSGRCGSTTAQLLKNPQSEILVYAPNREGWTFIINIPPNELEKNETFRYGEVRQFALDATNETSEAEHDLIARIGLPRSATLEANSTCIYRNGDYASGTRYVGTSLSAPSGVKIGSLAPHQWVYVTFKERLPTVGLTGNTATTYGAIASASKIGGPEWIEKSSNLKLELTGGT